MAAQERAEGGCSTPNRLAGRLANMLDTALETAEWASSMLRRREPTGLLFIEKLRRQLGFLSPLALLQICCLYTTVLIKLGSSLWFFHCGCLALFTATMTIGLTSCLERPRFNFGMSAEYAMMTFGLIIASHTVLLNLHALFQPDQAAQSARLVDSFFSYLMINHGVFWAVSPCPSPTRISWLCVFLACSFSDALCHAYLLEANALIWILRGPVVLCMSAVFGRLGVMFVLARSAKLEGTMGDLRVALDTNFSSVKQLVDVENIARAWERGPLVSINSYSTMAAILVSCLHAASMVFFNEAVLMQVGILQTLIFIGPWFLRYFHTRLNSGFSRLAVFLCPVLYPLRALRDIGDIAAWLGSKSNVGWCNAEVSTTEGITLATSTNPVSCNHFTLLELSEPIMEWSIEPYLDFARGLVAATLPLPPMRRQTSVAGVALSAFTRELRRGLIVSGNIPAEVVMGAALRGVVTVLMAALVARFTVHTAMAGCWQRARIMAEFELTRKEQLRSLAAHELRKAIARNVVDGYSGAESGNLLHSSLVRRSSTSRPLTSTSFGISDLTSRSSSSFSTNSGRTFHRACSITRQDSDMSKSSRTQDEVRFDKPAEGAGRAEVMYRTWRLRPPSFQPPSKPGLWEVFLHEDVVKNAVIYMIPFVVLLLVTMIQEAPLVNQGNRSHANIG